MVIVLQVGNQFIQGMLVGAFSLDTANRHLLEKVVILEALGDPVKEAVPTAGVESWTVELERVGDCGVANLTVPHYCYCL